MVSGTEVQYYHLCQRKLWLSMQRVEMEHTSELVQEGKQLHEQVYGQRAMHQREFLIERVRLDYFDAKRKIVHEVKRSKRREQAHIAQLQYYLYVLARNGFPDCTGILEYPKLRRTEEVVLTEAVRAEIPHWEAAIEALREAKQAPECAPKTLCRHCAYAPFCWA